MSIFLCSCSLLPEKENIVRDEDGTVIRMNPMWIHPLTDEAGLPHGVSSSVVVDDKIFIIRRFNGRDVFSLINVQSGDTRFEWNESNRPFSLIDADIKLTSDRILAVSRDLVLINHQNLTTETFLQTNDSQLFIGSASIGGRYFSSNYRNVDTKTNYRLSNVVEIFPNSTNTIDFITPEYPYRDEALDESDEAGWIINMEGVSLNGKDYLVIFYQDWLKDRQGILSLLSVYNVTDERWELSAHDVGGGPHKDAVGFHMRIYEGRLYFTDNRNDFAFPPSKIRCVDLFTGEPIWDFSFRQGFSTGNFEIQDGVLVINAEEIPTTVGLDANTGRLLWRVETGGTPGNIAIMNGVAYFAGASDGRLNAIDITTGKFLYRLERPANQRFGWKRFMAVVPGDGKRPDMIVASTYSHYMAFPAAR